MGSPKVGFDHGRSGLHRLASRRRSARERTPGNGVRQFFQRTARKSCAYAATSRSLKGDVLDRDAIVAAARGKDVISHQAAQLEITKCLEDPIGDLRTNLIGTINVLEAARQAGVERMINASSACIYGQAVAPPSVEDGSARSELVVRRRANSRPKNTRKYFPTISAFRFFRCATASSTARANGTAAC